MRENRWASIQHLYEAAVSINFAFAFVAFVFLLNPRPVTSTLFKMNLAIYLRLHLLPFMKHPKDYYNAGYFAFFVPAIALAVCSWLLLRASSRTNLLRELLRSVAGITALLAAPVWWLCSNYAASRLGEWNPFAAIQFYEAGLVLVLAILYLFGSWFIPEWIVIVIIALHYGFWFWQFGSRLYFMGYGGPVAPAAGLFAGLMWILYLRGQGRRVRAT